MINVLIIGPEYLKHQFSDQLFNCSALTESEISELKHSNVITKITSEHDIIVILYEIHHIFNSQITGLDILQHIRLSKNGNNQYSSTLFISAYSLENLTIKAPEAIILNAPKTRFLRLPFNIDKTEKLIEYFDNETLNYNVLKPYVPPISRDKIKNSHAFKNFEGIKINYEELKELEPQFKIDNVEKIIKTNNYELWYKRHSFLFQDSLENNLIDKKSIESTRKLIGSHQVLLIDDLATNGWSNILAYLFYGNQSSDNLETITSNKKFDEVFNINDNPSVENIIGNDKDIWELEKQIKRNETTIRNKNIELENTNKNQSELKVKIKELELSIENSQFSYAEENLENSIEELVDVYLDEDKHKRGKVIKQIIDQLKTSNRENQQLIENKKKLKEAKSELNNIQTKAQPLSKEIDNLKIKNRQKRTEKGQIERDTSNFKNYRIILLDLDLGNGKSDGLNLIKKIRTLNKMIPIIIFSSNEDINTLIDLSEHNISGCFIKGKHSLTELVNMISKLSINFYHSYNTWLLSHRLKKVIHISNSILTGHFYKSKSQFDFKDIDDSNRGFIRMLLEQIETVCKNDLSLKSMSLSLGSIQELYVSGHNFKDNKSFYFDNDDRKLRKLRNDSAHRDLWYKREEREKVQSYYDSLNNVLKKLYPYQL
jgi:CheY-like chemotaxis protein